MLDRVLVLPYQKHTVTMPAGARLFRLPEEFRFSTMPKWGWQRVCHCVGYESLFPAQVHRCANHRDTKGDVTKVNGPVCCGCGEPWVRHSTFTFFNL